MLLALAPSLLSACGTGSYSGACPPLREYTREFQNELADEVVALPPAAVRIPEALSDYAVLRDQVRACRR